MATVEATELALRVVDMVRAAPEGGIATELRAALVQRLRAQVPTLTANTPGDQMFDQLASAFTDDVSLPTTIFKDRDWPWPFRLVLRKEIEEIEDRRVAINRVPSVRGGAPDVYELATQKNLVGLALSGGGIRSATFSLGVLQRLADKGFLTQVDYLSTVSGGGYIGTWLSSWIHRTRDPNQVYRSLSPNATPDPNAEAVKSIRFLRQFSNYLTPQLGLFSFDTWTMAAVFVRNVALNLAILLTGFGALLLAPRLLGRFWGHAPNVLWPLIAGIGLVVFSVMSIANNVKHATQEQPSAAQARPEGFYGPVQVQIYCCAPLLLGAYSLAWWLWQHCTDPAVFAPHPAQLGFWGPPLGFIVLSSLLASTSNLSRRFKERIDGNNFESFVVCLLVPAGVGVAGWAMYRAYIAGLYQLTYSGMEARWNALVFGPPLLLSVLSIAGIVHVGLLGIDLLDSGREWLSRFRGVTNIYTVFWLGLFTASVYGGLLFAKFAIWSRATLASLGLAWVVTTVISFRAGGSRKTGDSNDAQPGVSGWEIVAKVGPPVFVVGFVWIIAAAEHFLLALSTQSFGRGSVLSQIRDCYWDVLTPASYFGLNLLLPGSLALACAVTCLILAWRVDINEFSMHHFYKNRLVRCYLGATRSNDRKPNAFTGFDENDDVRLSELRPSSYGAPYHILNATLNLSAGKNLAWQERKAASFFFSPLFSGYDLNLASPQATLSKDSTLRSRARGPLRSCAFRTTERYAFQGGVHIGTAMSISGAAADPNQGYNTSPAVAFLMTVFDVRLGWWLGNPRIDKKSKSRGPVFGLAALISELLGTTDDTTNFINLSDGGHFDNLGLYELIRRHCKYIVVCDAEQDSSYRFGGLGMAIRKCRIDFGAEIQIDPQQIMPRSDNRRSEHHCAFGRVIYNDGSEGMLLYIKASLTGDEPEDLLEYSAAHAKFPHESTADQWFAESQFESYRKLGYHAADSALTPARIFSTQHDEKNIADVFDTLKKFWYPLNPGLRLNAIKHTNTLNELVARIGQTPGLQFLGARLFPGAQHGTTRDQAAEFYFCMCLIQLVEDVYFDFNLDQARWLSDPRIGGWMTLFKRWALDETVNTVWNQQLDTFRKDFQIFWNLVRTMD